MKIAGFLSYSHEDGSELTVGLAKYLKNLIQSFEPVYDEDVYEGNRLEKIPERLLLCNILIVIITPAVLKSKAVSEEIKLAKEKNMKIIPCKDHYLQMDWTELPWNLEQYKGFEFENLGELKRKTYASLIKNLHELSKELKKSIPKKIDTEKSPITQNEERELDQTDETLSWDKYTVKSKKKEHNIMGTVKNGTIKKVMLERKSLSLLIDVKMHDEGFLKIITRRELIDSRDKEKDLAFIVLVDGEEVNHDELSPSIKQRAIQVKLTKHSKNIQIIGTEIEGISYGGEARKETEVRILEGSSEPHGKQYIEPEILKIKIGDTVKWINDDSAAHTVTSGTPGEGSNGNFDSSLLISKATFSVTFNDVGTYPYLDMVHPWIIGTIVVEE